MVINTHRGLFQYNRLSYGVSSAPVFQWVMNGLPIIRDRRIYASRAYNALNAVDAYMRQLERHS